MYALNSCCAVLKLSADVWATASSARSLYILNIENRAIISAANAWNILLQEENLFFFFHANILQSNFPKYLSNIYAVLGI